MTRPVTTVPHRRTALLRRIRTSLVSVLAVVLATQSLSAVPAAAATQTISGTVSFGTPGNHPEGVTARVLWDRFDGWNWQSGPQEGVSTDPEGGWSLSLEPGTYRIRFSPMTADYQGLYWNGTSITNATRVTVGDSPITDMDLTLPIKGSISGTVYLGSGDRTAGAGQVRATAYRCYESGCVSGGEPTALTDASGTYTFSGLYNGVYTIRFAYLAGAEFQAPVAPVIATVSLTQQVFTGMDVTMPVAASISGAVTLGTSGARAGAGEVLVTARRYLEGGAGGWSESTVHTGPDGTYLFSGLPRGTYELKFSYLGTGGFAEQWWPGNPVPSVDGTRFVLGEAPLVRDVRLPAAASLGGTVRNAANVPIPDVIVVASVFDDAGFGAAAEVARTRTAGDGTYSFSRLPPGGYRVAFMDEAETSPYVGTTRSDGLRLVAGDRRTGYDATLYRPTMLSGIIRCDGCSDYDVARSLGVRLERNVGTRAQPVWVDAGFTGTWANGEGAYYEFRNSDGGLFPGIYRASVEGDWGWRPRPNASPAVTIEDGAQVVLDLDIEFLKFDRDFSGDEAPDVLVRTAGGAMLMYTGNGASGWTGASTIGSGWTIMNHVFAAGDFSGDGHEDVMARDWAGNLHLYRGDGKGGWLGQGLVGTGWGRMTAIFSPGDFSGDGHVDVLARDGAGDLWMYPGNGKGGWGVPSKVGSGWNMFDRIFAAGGFGGYGGANVMGRTPSGDLYAYPASGSGGWATPALVGTGWTIFDAVFGSGDFDGDGNDDVMGRDRAGNLWLYPGRGGFGWGNPSVVGTGWGHLSFVS